MTHVTCRLTAKNPDQLRNPTLGYRVWATFPFFTYVAYLVRLRLYATDRSHEFGLLISTTERFDVER